MSWAARRRVLLRKAVKKKSTDRCGSFGLESSTEIGWESTFRGCVNPRNHNGPENGNSAQVSLALETLSNGF